MEDLPKKKIVRRVARKTAKPTPSGDTVVLDWLIERLEALGGRYGTLAAEAQKRR